MKKTTKPIFNIFNIKRLLLACRIYDNDLINEIVDSISIPSTEHKDLLYDHLVKIVYNKTRRNIDEEMKVMKVIVNSKLALVPLIFGFKQSNESLVAINLSYFLNIPNIVLTDTIQQTLNIYEYKSINKTNYQNHDIMEYLEESKKIVSTIKTDINKAIKQGKSIILCGYNLFIPYIFQFTTSGLFPEPIIINDSKLNRFPLYYLASKNENLANILFIPIALETNIDKNEGLAKPLPSKFQDIILGKMINNEFNWPIHVIKHEINNPQKTSECIHILIMNTLKVLFNTNIVF